MNYVLLDCDYTEREDYRLNKEVKVEDIESSENTLEFVSKVVAKESSLADCEHVSEIVFEPFVKKESALVLIDEYGDKRKVELLEDLVYATYLIEGDPKSIDRGLEVVCSDVVSLKVLYERLEDMNYSLPIVISEDIKNDIASGTMLKRENLLAKTPNKVK